MDRLTFDRAANRDAALSLIIPLKRRELVFFAGAALSNAPPSNLPLGGKIKDKTLEAVLGRLSLITGGAGRILAEQRLRRLRKLPLEVMFQFVYNVIGPAAVDAFRPLDTDRSMPRFNHNHQFLGLAAGDMTPLILTTNWDHLIEDALAFWRKAYTAYAEDEQILGVKDIYNAGVIPIVKLHGTIERAESIIVTMEQAGDRLSSLKAAILADVLKDYYVCFVGYGMGDYDIYSTLRMINPARVKGLYILLKPPSNKEDEKDFHSRNAQPLAIIEATDGFPIVLDICEFFDILCDEAFPSAHAMHTKQSVMDGQQPNLEEHIDEWSMRISPYEAHSIIGSLYYHVGDGEASAVIYQSAMDNDLASTNRQMARLRLGRGYAFARKGNYRQYLLDSRAAYRLARRAGRPFDIAESLFHWGDALRQLGVVHLLRAYIALHQAASIYKRIEGRVARHGRGSAVLSSSLIVRAVLPRLPALRSQRNALLERFEHAYSLLGGPNGNALRLIGELHGELGDTQKALAYAADAELVCKWHEDDVGLANTMRAKAKILRWNGQVGEARNCYLRALRASRRAGDDPGIIKALDGLAQLALNSGRFYRCKTLRHLAIRELGPEGWGRFGPALTIRLATGLAACYIRLLIGLT